MNLLEISKKIDKSSKNECSIYLPEFDRELDFSFEHVDQERLKAYWIGRWYCTDSYVGYRMYFLDDEPVAVSTQIGRKYDEEYEWFSHEAAMKVRTYLISLVTTQETELNLNFCNLGEDIGDSFKIEFSAQILDAEKATFQNEPVKIIKRIKKTPDYGIDTELEVQLSSGEVTRLNVKDLDFKFNLSEV